MIATKPPSPYTTLRDATEQLAAKLAEGDWSRRVQRRLLLLLAKRGAMLERLELIEREIDDSLTSLVAGLPVRDDCAEAAQRVRSAVTAIRAHRAGKDSVQ